MSDVAEKRTGSQEPSALSLHPPHSEESCSSNEAAVAIGWRRGMFLVLAMLFFGLGVLGALLPGIPATPFLLLTSFFLVRSSRRLNSRLLKSRLFGPILVDWQVHGGVRPHVRIKAIAAVVVAVTASIWISGMILPASLIIAGLAVTGIMVILMLPAAQDS